MGAADYGATHPAASADQEVSPRPRTDPPAHRLKSERDAVLLCASIAAVACATVATSPPEDLGWRIWALVAGWHASVVVVAWRRGHALWLELWGFLLPLCACMVFPDGFLVRGLGTLAFPNRGVGTIYGVPSFMPLMWAAPLFASTLAGIGMRDRGFGGGRAALGAGAASLVMIGCSEAVLTRVPVWRPIDCTTVWGRDVAAYVLFPEFCLGVCTFLGWEFVRWGKEEWGKVSLLQRISVAFMIMCTYLGNLIVCYMIIDGDKL